LPVKRGSVEVVTLKEKVNRIFYFFYELALLLTLCILFLAPIHMAATRHYNIDKILGPSRVSFTAQDTSSIAPGDVFPVYRFNPDWTSEIGSVMVDSISGHQVIASFDPNEFRWPMGRQGQVVAVNGSMLKVTMGSGLGLKPGDMLNLFDARTMAGKIRLQEVHPDYSWANILSMAPGVDPQGLTASEFIYVTQVSFFKAPLVTLVEVGLFIFVLISHCYYFIFCKKPILLSLGNWLRPQYQCIPKILFHWTINIILGVPFIAVMVNFIPRCVVYLSNTVINLINSTFHFSIGILNIYPWFNENIIPLYLVAAVTYLSILIWSQRSPILLFWQWVGYKREEKAVVGGVWRDVIIWFLHLIIFYAFGRTLWGFLTGNLNACAGLMSTKHFTLDHSLLVIRYLLWSVTIVGCLFGYGYSVLGYLYGKRIRNLDFTAMGWVTNAVCYGPLLGGVIAQMTPSLMGLDPVLAQGPLKNFVLIAELILNFLYTVSILNLGTMFGVMTDKGVRKSGLYSVVRHPSYTLESLMFLMVFFNGLSYSAQWLAMGVFVLNYYVRSEREDQFMAASNPEYKLYQQKTPYKFIPGIY